MSATSGISVNLRATQPEGRFYMGLDEALALYEGGLAEAILLAVEKLESELEREKISFQVRRHIVKRARQAITNSNIK